MDQEKEEEPTVDEVDAHLHNKKVKEATDKNE